MTKFTLILATALAATAQSVLAHPQEGQGGGGGQPRVQEQRSAPVMRERAMPAPVERGRVFSAPVERGRVFSAPVERGRVFSAPVERGRVFSAPVERGRVFSAPVERGRVFSGPIERDRPAQFRVEHGNLVLQRPRFVSWRDRDHFVQVIPRSEVIPGFATIVQTQTFVRVVPRQIVYAAPVVSVFPDIMTAAFVPSLVTPEFITPSFVTPTFFTPPSLAPVDYVYQGYAPVYAEDVAYVTPIATPYIVNPYGNAQLQGVVLAQTGSNLLVMTPSLQTVFVDTGIAQQDGYLEGAVQPGSVVNVLGYDTGGQFIATALI